MARTQHWIKCNIFSQPSDPPGLVARRSVIYFRLEIISTIIKSNSYTCPHSDMRAAPPPAPPSPDPHVVQKGVIIRHMETLRLTLTPLTERQWAN